MAQEMQPEAATPCTETFYPLTDHLGTVVTLLDHNGAVVYTQHYNPFGQRDATNSDAKPIECNNGEASDPWPYGFTGQQGDAESGLIYMHARYYNPAIGHFMTPDTVLPNPGDSCAYDRYAYCRNNPVNLVDPTGHFWGLFFAFVAVGAAVGGIIAAINHGNILTGMLAGAVSGAMTFFGTDGHWAYLAVTQSVNAALHATSGGRWLIQEVGDAIGSQVLGDMIVSAMATGAVLRMTGVAKGGMPEGPPMSPEQDAGASSLDDATAHVGDLYASLDEAARTGNNQQLSQCELEIAEWGKAVNEGYNAQAAANTLSKAESANNGSGFGQHPVLAVAAGRKAIGETKIVYKCVYSCEEDAVTLQPMGLLFDAPVRVGNVDITMLQHTAASAIGQPQGAPYPGWSYTWGTGVCHQSTSLYLHRLLGEGVRVTPFDLTAHWTAMLSTGLYGYYGLPGGLFWRASEQYIYEQTHY
jgi:RHS repeat-associated protein